MVWTLQSHRPGFGVLVRHPWLALERPRQKRKKIPRIRACKGVEGDVIRGCSYGNQGVGG